MFKKLAAATAISAALAFSPATAQEQPTFVDTLNYQIGLFELVADDPTHEDHGKKFFLVLGDFKPGITNALAAGIEAHPDVKMVAFNSTGGVGDEGYSMANLLSEKKIQPWIPKGRVCLSACAEAFMGGWDYRIDGQLGFHVHWYPANGRTFTGDQLNQYVKYSQLSQTRTVFHHLTNGFSISLSADIARLTTKDNFLIFRDAESFMEYYVRDDELEEGVGDLTTYLSKWPEEHIVAGSQEIGEYAGMQYEELAESSSVRANFLELIATTVAPPVEESEETADNS